MNVRDLKKIDTTYPLDNQWMRVRLDRFQLPTRIAEFYTLEGPPWVIICAVTPNKEIVFVKQYRNTTQKDGIELPAGKMDKKEETPEEAIRRELKEETGYELTELHHLSQVDSLAGRANIIGHLFSGKTGKRTIQELDDTEDIEVLHVSLTQALNWAHTGQLTNLPSLAALLLTKERFPAWFTP